METIHKGDKAFEDRVKSKGGFIIVLTEEPCYGCGHKKFMAYPEKTDGRVDIKYECIYCLVRCPTSANRSGP